MKKILFFLLLVNTCLITSIYAQKPAVVADHKEGWHRIAGLQANFKKQDESVMVMGNDEFTALKFKVVDAPVSIDRMQVFYESGDMEDIDVKKDMSAGEESAVFNLKNAGKDISKVAFTYHTIANSKGEKAELEIYGLKGQHDTAYDKAKNDVNETGKDIENAAEKTGDQISETASKAAAEIDDDRLSGKLGPEGQTVYIADDGSYYYVNEEGKRVTVTSDQLKDK